MIDVRPWLDETEEPATPELRRRTIRIARLIEYGGTLRPRESRMTLVECTDRAGRSACTGFLRVSKSEDDSLEALCPLCDSQSILIIGWQETEYAEGPPAPFPAKDISALNLVHRSTRRDRDLVVGGDLRVLIEGSSSRDVHGDAT